jgi:hypothetical protein
MPESFGEINLSDSDSLVYTTNTTIADNEIKLTNCSPYISWNDFNIQISKNLNLQKRNNNFLIVNSGKTCITWSDEIGSWVEYKVCKLEKKFKKNLKSKECKPFRGSDTDDGCNLNVMDILICQEGNYYVDLKNSLYYVFSDGFWNSVDLIGELTLEIEGDFNLNKIKNKSKQKSLLLETWKPLSFSLDKGYIYAPYVPINNCKKLNEDLTESFSAYEKISSRFYSTINIA